MLTYTPRKITSHNNNHYNDDKNTKNVMHIYIYTIDMHQNNISANNEIILIIKPSKRNHTKAKQPRQKHTDNRAKTQAVWPTNWDDIKKSKSPVKFRVFFERQKIKIKCKHAPLRSMWSNLIFIAQIASTFIFSHSDNVSKYLWNSNKHRGRANKNENVTKVILWYWQQIRK